MSSLVVQFGDRYGGRAYRCDTMLAIAGGDMSYDLKEMAALAKEHWAVATGIATVGGSFATLIFLYAYLSVFDGSLVWLIEYPDLFKLFVIGIALASSVSGVLFLLSYVIYIAVKDNNALSIAVYFLILIILGGALFYYTYYNPDKGSSSLAVALMSFMTILAGYFSLGHRTFYYRVVLASSCIGLVAAGGKYAAEAVKSQPNGRKVFVKSAGPPGITILDDARVVMMLSHHSVFYHNAQVITVPSGEIVRIETQLPTVPASSAAATPSSRFSSQSPVVP